MIIKSFLLKMGVHQVILTIYLCSFINIILCQNLITRPESENRNRVSFYPPLPRMGPHLVSGAVPLPVTQQFVPRLATVQNPGITENFARTNQSSSSNHRQSAMNVRDSSASNYQPGHGVNNPHLSINMGLSRDKNESIKYIRVSNNGAQDEFVQMTVLDSEGYPMRVTPSQFPLGVGATAEIPFTIPIIYKPQQGRSSSLSYSGSGVPTPQPLATSSNMITVLARGKRENVQRSFVFGDPYDDVNYNIGPFCVDKDVTGTCRYRDDPVDCFRWEWTAYATILNNDGGPSQKITSLPEGLFLTPGEHGRVRVYLKISCCTPYVQFIATDIHYNTAIKSCVVDVRELQTLHPGEIAGIVIGAVLLLIIIIAIIVICVRKRRSETINKEIGMIPRLRSRTRTRSKEVITRQQL